MRTAVTQPLRVTASVPCTFVFGYCRPTAETGRRVYAAFQPDLARATGQEPKEQNASAADTILALTGE